MFWTVAVSETVLFTILMPLVAVCYELRIYFRAPDPRLFLSLASMPGGRLGPVFRLFRSILESAGRLGIHHAARSCCFRVGRAQAVFY